MNEPRSPLAQLGGDLGRLTEIASVAVRHGFGTFLQSLPLPRHKGSVDPSNLDLPMPRRLGLAMQELGPTFVKLGQMLSTRQDLLPAEFVEEFARLQDEVPPFPSELARSVVEEELGAPVEALFAEFSSDPVASASMAQVHRARLPDGTDVAVKIQRPGIERTLRADISILYSLAELLEQQIDLGVQRPQQIVAAFDRAIALEVDFLNEATHAERFSRAVGGVEGVVVPRVHRRFSSRRVLVLDWVGGVKLSRIDETDADPDVVMDRLVAATFEQIFVHGWFHADPHPGNLVVTPKGELAYLDFGLMGRVTPEMRDTLEQLCVAVIFRDADGAARTLYRAGSSDGRVDLRRLSGEIDTLFNKYGGTTLAEQDSGAIALELLDLAREHRLSLPDEFAVLARAQVALDGIARELVPGWDPEATIRPYAMRLARERMDPDRVGGDLARTALTAAGVLKDLPGQLDQLLLDLERGHFEVTAKTPSVDRLTETIDRLGRSLVFGLGVSAFLLSASILVAVLVLSRGPGGFGLFDLGIAFALVASLLAATGLVTALLWSLFVQERLRRLRLSHLLRLLPLGRRGKRD